MARASLNGFLRCLTRGMAAETLADHSDRQLVERALAKRDEAAFQVIVCRHGPMVYRVCWRVLEHPQDAEDAFQATFLVLAQKLPTLRKDASLASWLHGIAHRVALKAKAEVAARRRRERLASQPSTRLPDDVTWGELRSALDGELSRLPDKWRQPLILCYLEGRTQEESANQLGWSKSTLRRRLAEARTALARRLKRRGIVLPAALSAVLLSDCLAWAAPVPGLVASTAEAAAGVAAGNTVVAAASAKAAALAEGVLKAMFPTKLKWTATLLLVVGIVACGTAGFNFQFLTSEEPKAPAAKVESRAVPKPTDKQTQPNEGLDDAKSLQGEWQAVDGEKGGKPLAEEPKDLRIIFKGDEISLFGDGKKKYRLDTGKSPRELHIDFLDDKLKHQTIRMIYSLEKGELKLCMPLGPEIAPPTDFKTKAGSNLLLLVLRRATKDGAGVKRPDDLANIKREWRRADAAPDGNYKLSYVYGTTEETCCLVKLVTKDATQSASLVDTDKSDPVTAVHTEMPPSSAPTGQATGKGVHIRLVFTTPRDDLVFDGSFSPPSLEARGHLEQGGKVFPATLTATDLTKLKFTIRSLPATPLQKALRLGHIVDAMRQRAEFAKDAAEKAGFVKKAALAEKEALAEAPKLFQEGFENYADDPLAFEAAVEAARFATKYHIPADQLRAMIAKADKTAASYGRDWQREFKLRIAAALAPQKDYAALALDIARRLEKELVPAHAAATRERVLKALAAAEANAGSSAAVRDTLAGLLAKLEETLDREYRAKVPPFKPVSFAGRKARSDRAVVLELFTGTQCPPCVAAAVAFDALHETYRPAELVLIQYHLHIPGPDPLANADSEARVMYYAKSFPDEVRGVPTTLFNGKPQAGSGGDMTQAEVKYKQYRQVIDPLLETTSAAKLSASAVKQGNKVNIKVEVTDLKKPGRDIRLRLLLVEETVRYVGGNRVRLHHHVVRSMVGGADGFALNDKHSKHAAAVDLDVLRKSLEGYLEDYNSNRRPFPNADRPLDLSDLRLIALVQDDATREIIQAAEVEIIAQGKTATKD
jgi:RNA polymerase sigma factor (sigma-70 family)